MKKIDLTQFDLYMGEFKYCNSKRAFKKAWRDCKRGDWMLSLAEELKIDDRVLTRAKALCANTVRHLMTDKRSIAAVEAALRYAEGKISRAELNEYADIAGRVVDTNKSIIMYKSAYAAYVAAAPNGQLYDVATACADAAIIAPREETLKRTAAICKEILTKPVFEKINQLQKENKKENPVKSIFKKIKQLINKRNEKN